MDFPIENGGSFHSYVTVYQRVNPKKTLLIGGVLEILIHSPAARRPGSAWKDSGTGDSSEPGQPWPWENEGKLMAP